ncbi:MAG: carboxypeptidase regulatory-like domain-containing protein [Blastocatellia bacterium]|nr:carboxypeptidase regulatory-like domain-containing protein [Blastocatellia bacterium]
MVILTFTLSAFGQTTTSTIEGTVTDANGAVISGATVKTVGASLERSVTTDKEGFYRLVALPAGVYTITISQTGFANSTNKIELTLNRVAIFNTQLQVGGNVGEVSITGRCSFARNFNRFDRANGHAEADSRFAG